MSDLTLDKLILQEAAKGKLLSPARRRCCIEHARRELWVSECRACAALGQHRSTQRRAPQVLVLTILRDAGLIGVEAFSALIVTALLTTVLAALLVRIAFGHAGPRAAAAFSREYPQPRRRSGSGQPAVRVHCGTPARRKPSMTR